MDAKTLYLLVIILFADPVLARFDPVEAERVDPEENNNTETWNDKNSYRYPVIWERPWGDSEMGYRVNAGSLNVSKFNFEDDVKIAPKPLEQFTAAFVQSRREDLAERSIEREVRVGWGFIEGMRLSVLGDVNTLKEFGDLGVALALHESMDGLTEFYAWSVDHYYLSKRSDEGATRDEESRTYGFRSKSKVGSSIFGWQLRFEWDTPIDWTLPTSGWRYQYDKRLFDGRFDYRSSQDKLLYVSGSWERKFERKTVISQSDVESKFKSMVRDSLLAEFGLEYQMGEESFYTAAIQRVYRRANYKMPASFPENSIIGETRSPSSVLRNEWGLILSKYSPLKPNISIQHGAFLNDVFVVEDLREWRVQEMKYQLLFDFDLNDRTKFALNTTWDVDQIIRDYPYPKDKPFRPWGGGDLQFMMKI